MLNSINPAVKNVTLLAVCQALAMTGDIILFTVAALIGFELATDKALATLPLALRQIATTLTTIPAAMLMRRIGQRWGFWTGALIGCLSTGVAVQAVLQQSFWLFCAGVCLNGVAHGFVGYYRFAAADAAPEAWRAQAISWVITGGVVAAIAGPWFATQSANWFPDTLYLGALGAILVLQMMGLLLVLGLTMPPLPQVERQQSGRPLRQIAQQPVFWVAALGSMAGYGVMTLIMTATPLAMAAIPHPFHQTATVIQWHVLGMFAPAFFTGWLIRRFGALNIVLVGTVLNLLSMGTNLSGSSFPHFVGGLLLLGIGWNFMFVGATTLLTSLYTPAEKAKTQATHDFMMFGFVALTTLLSGQVFYRFSWSAVNALGLPVIGLALVAALWLKLTNRTSLPTPTPTAPRRGA